MMARDLPGGDARRQLALGWAVIMAVAGAICLLNVLGFSRGGRESVGLHLIYEGSSWLAIALLAWAPFFILRWGRPRALVAALAAHALGAGLFALGHVGLFILFRAAAFAILALPYDLAEAVGEFRYEVWKDLLTYALLVGTYGLIGYLDQDRSAPEQDPQSAPFDIRDGARLVRASMGDILAVSAAGNYAEFHLRDGRRPLMRSSLSALESELAAAGFVRTHRSWLVNGAAVTGLAPEGSGDYRIELGDLSAPLSRRYREALHHLRQAR